MLALGGGWGFLFCFGDGGVTWMLKNNVGVSLRVCFVLFWWFSLGFCWFFFTSGHTGSNEVTPEYPLFVTTYPKS